MPESLTSFGAAVVGEYLYVFSGHDGKYIYRIGGLSFIHVEDKQEAIFNSTAHFARYDIEADTWTELEPLPVPRSSLDAAIVERTIYVVGGWDLQGEGAARNAPLPEVTIPHPRRSFGGALIGDEYFMIGGLGEGMQIESTVDIFDLQTRRWRTAASPASPRVFPMVVAEDKKIYLFGGFSNANGHFVECPSLEVYDRETDQWTTVAETIPGVDASLWIQTEQPGPRHVSHERPA